MRSDCQDRASRAAALAAALGLLVGLVSCSSLEPELPELPGSQRPVGPADILGSASAASAGRFLGGGPVGRPTPLPDLPSFPGDGRIEGLARPSGTRSGDSWTGAELRVVPEPGGARLEFVPPMGFDVVLRQSEIERLRSRLQRVDGWVELAPANDSLERWMLEKRWMVPGEGGTVAARRRIEVWFHARGRGEWTGLRIELREEERPEFGWEGDFLLSPAEAGDWLAALP